MNFIVAIRLSIGHCRRCPVMDRTRSKSLILQTCLYASRGKHNPCIPGESTGKRASQRYPRRGSPLSRHTGRRRLLAAALHPGQCRWTGRLQPPRPAGRPGRHRAGCVTMPCTAGCRRGPCRSVDGNSCAWSRPRSACRLRCNALPGNSAIDTGARFHLLPQRIEVPG